MTRWLPFLLYYSGARIGELAGSSTAAIQIVDGLPCIVLSLATRAPGDRLKTVSSRRTFPIDQPVIDEGFLSYVKELLENNPTGSPLFPDLKQDRDGKRSDDAGDRMGRFIREVCKIADPLIKPGHSFRFTFSTEASRHNENGEVLISEQIVDQIEGYKPAGKKISRGYVAMPVATLAAAIGKLPNPLESHIR